MSAIKKIATVKHPDLPKSGLVNIGVGKSFYFAKFRGANFKRYQIGWFNIVIRADYLLHVALFQYPHLFK